MTAVVQIRDAAPVHLSPEARAWWGRILAEYDIGDDGGRFLLQSALESFDVMRACEKQVAADGLLAKGSRRQPRAHPLLATARDARQQMLAALKLLNLDLEPDKRR